MDASLPGLEDEYWFDERVLRRIRSTKANRRKAQRKRPDGLIIALMLVMVLTTAVHVSLWRRGAADQQFAAAALLSDDSVQQPEETPCPEEVSNESAYEPNGLSADPGDGAIALIPSTLAGCGHGNVIRDSIRRYTPINDSEHKYVETFYTMCADCGQVFNVHDVTKIRETHLRKGDEIVEVRDDDLGGGHMRYQYQYWRCWYCDSRCFTVITYAK